MRATPEHTSLTVLKGIGPALEEKLNRLGLRSVEDVLFHLPLRYQDRTRITPIGALRPGMDGVIEGVILGADVVMGRRRSLLCRIQDGRHRLSLRFYYFSAALKASLQRGSHWRCHGGSAHRGLRTGDLPPGAAEPRSAADRTGRRHADAHLPGYRGLSQQRLRKLSESALGWLAQGNSLPELLPAEVIDEYRLPPLREAIHTLHRPPPDVDLLALEEGRHWAQHRLAFEELLAHQLTMLRLRAELRAWNAPVMQASGELATAYVSQLGFPLTGAQQRVAEEIRADLQQPQPMLRLVQGDVGAGKTVVAALAALQALEAGWQVALMAPTEILAEQHFNNFQRWFAALGISVAWMAGKLKGKARANQLQMIATGEAGMVVGTHALFQDEVIFRNLGLAIIDEQHRFGVSSAWRCVTRPPAVSPHTNDHDRYPHSRAPWP